MFLIHKDIALQSADIIWYDVTYVIFRFLAFSLQLCSFVQDICRYVSQISAVHDVALVQTILVVLQNSADHFWLRESQCLLCQKREK